VAVPGLPGGGRTGIGRGGRGAGAVGIEQRPICEAVIMADVVLGAMFVGPFISQVQLLCT
jgi:hypothetical protein